MEGSFKVAKMLKLVSTVLIMASWLMSNEALKQSVVKKAINQLQNQ